MKIMRHYDAIPHKFRGSVVLIGNFDGVHQGHKEVIGKAAQWARASEVPLVLITFEPHPRRYFRPKDPPFSLTPLRSKMRHLSTLGLDLILLLHFDDKLSQKSAEDFARELLTEALEASRVVVGYNFVFGHKRKGDVSLLKSISRTHGFSVAEIEPVGTVGGEVYSSTLIREYLESGKPIRAAELLGRPFEIEGRVIPGDRRGVKIGFPTANISLGDYIRPAFGVYAVHAGEVQGEKMVWHEGVANLGIRPTVDGSLPLLETYLFDFSDDLYGRHLRVRLIEYLRPERKFENLDTLSAQIAEDCESARRMLLKCDKGALDRL